MSSSATAHFPSLPVSSTIAADSSRGSGASATQPELSDEVLLNNICAGNRDSLALLFHRYANSVRNVGQRILRDKAEADDLVQEVFIYIHRKSAVFDTSKGSATSWIIQVAYTQAFLRRRVLKSHGFYLSGIADKPAECHQQNPIGPDYDHTFEGLVGRNTYKEIIEGLTVDQRETLRLHFFEGYTFAEIAEKLGQSYANVRHHHYRGLEKLRKHLTEDGWSRR